MATKYDRVVPQEEKLKRLYNCPRLAEIDQRYLNFSFDRHKTRQFHIVSICCFGGFAASAITVVKQATALKYWSFILIFSYSSWKYMTMLNN
jgi:hypothetical protein